MLLVNLKIEGCSRILSPRLAAGLTSKTVAVRSIWVTRRLDCSASLELPLILPNELYLGPPPHILPTIQKAIHGFNHLLSNYGFTTHLRTCTCILDHNFSNFYSIFF